MKYQVVVPAPKTKRMTGKVFLRLEDGWGPGSCREISEAIPGPLDFEVPDGHQWKPTALDAASFSVYVEWFNSTGTRTERVYLQPAVGLRSQS